MKNKGHFSSIGLSPFVVILYILSSNYQDTGRFWPGLGGTETDYARAVTCRFLFEFVTMPITAVMAHRLPFTISMLFNLSLFAVGGAVYALAVNVWMVYIGQGLIGAGVTCATTIHTYVGEMGTIMDHIRVKQGKKPRKFIVYAALSFLFTGGYLIAYCKLLKLDLETLTLL